MSSPWEVPQRHPLTASPETRGIWSMFRAVPPAVPVRLWRQEKTLPGTWVLIPAVPSVSQAPSAVLPESNRPTEQYPVTDWLPMLPLWIRSEPVGKDVADCAALLEMIAGHDAERQHLHEDERILISPLLMTDKIRGNEIRCAEGISLQRAWIRR